MKKRQIIIDTETTGFDPLAGDRVIEIGCLVMEDLILTGETLHYYVNPEGKAVAEGAFAVHQISNEFLADKPVFADIADELIAFIADADLVAHNADFDRKFLNWELEQAGHQPYPESRFVDTLALARSKFPGAQNSLDALCQRFGIDHAHRTRHGALLDSTLLAEVYVELMGGKQTGFALNPVAKQASGGVKKTRPYRRFPLSDEEAAAHAAFLGHITNPLWLREGRPT